MKRALFIGLLAAMLGACTVAPPRGPAGESEQTWRIRQRALAALNAWSFDGRIGVTLGMQGWHANLNWVQRIDSYDIRISGPLGRGVGLLHGDLSGVVLRTSDHKEFHAADAESLMYTQFGWWVPVRGLNYWLRGLPEPTQAAQTTLDANGQLTHLIQADWDIRFTRYAKVGDLSLPDRMTLSNAKMKVKLIVDGWRTP